MNDPFISIVIPVYNTNRIRLERCVNSAIDQTYQNYEVVIVDDGSTEDCKRLIHEVCDRDDKIRMVSQNNMGSGAARNLGIKVSKGEYVLFLDSDDMLSTCALEDAVKCLQIEKADLIVGQIHKEKETEWDKRLIDDNDQNPLIILTDKKEHNEYINHILGFQSKRFCFPNRYFCDGPVAKLCRKTLLQDSLFDLEKMWSEDTIWNLKYTKSCQTIVISPRIWYYAFANDASQTHIFRPNCAYEFQYRIQQKQDLVTELWPSCRLGLYAQIWVSTHYLFACFLSHRNNKDSFFTKYRIFINCISQPAYQEMLKGISFEDENNRIKKIIKKILKSLSLRGPRILAFYGWQAVIRARKGER